jgi:hypothetical protein
VKLSGFEHVGGNSCFLAVCFIIVSSVRRWFLVSLVVALFSHQASEWTNHIFSERRHVVGTAYAINHCAYRDLMKQGLVCSTWSAGPKHLVCQPFFAFATWILCPRPACRDVLKACATGISTLAPAQVLRPVIAGNKLALCLSFCEIATCFLHCWAIVSCDVLVEVIALKLGNWLPLP